MSNNAVTSLFEITKKRNTSLRYGTVASWAGGKASVDIAGGTLTELSSLVPLTVGATCLVALSGNSAVIVGEVQT